MVRRPGGSEARPSSCEPRGVRRQGARAARRAGLEALRRRRSLDSFLPSQSPQTRRPPSGRLRAALRGCGHAGSPPGRRPRDGAPDRAMLPQSRTEPGSQPANGPHGRTVRPQRRWRRPRGPRQHGGWRDGPSERTPGPGGDGGKAAPQRAPRVRGAGTILAAFSGGQKTAKARAGSAFPGGGQGRRQPGTNPLLTPPCTGWTHGGWPPAQGCSPLGRRLSELPLPTYPANGSGPAGAAHRHGVREGTDFGSDLVEMSLRRTRRGAGPPGRGRCLGGCLPGGGPLLLPRVEAKRGRGGL